MKRLIKTTKQMTALMTALAITSVSVGGRAITVEGQASTVNGQSRIFKDVPEEHWAKDYIYDFRSHGYIAGYTDNTFKPTKSIIRAEVAAILANVGVDEVYQEVLFTDIKDNVWYTNKVAVTTKIGLMDGDGNGKFNPDNVLTRNEAFKIAAMTYPRVDVSHIQPDFVDQYTVPDWALEFEKTLIYYDVLHGFEDGTVRGNDTISRAEFVKLFGNLVNTDSSVITQNIALWHEDDKKNVDSNPVVIDNKPIIKNDVVVKEKDNDEDNDNNQVIPKEPTIPLIPIEPANPIVPDEPADPIIPLTPLEPAKPIVSLEVDRASEIDGNVLSEAPNKYKGNYPWYKNDNALVIKDELVIDIKQNVETVTVNGNKVYTKGDVEKIEMPVENDTLYTIVITDIEGKTTTKEIFVDNIRDGSKERPWAVINEDDLKNLAGSDEYYEQCAAIELAGNWEPIDGFLGYYYGNQLKISNLDIVSEDNVFSGLFRELEQDGVISNINLEIGTVKLKTKIPEIYTDVDFGFGGLVGHNKGTIEKCVVTIPNSSEIVNEERNVLSNIGGVVSKNDGTITETKIVVDGKIEGYDTVGALVAVNYGDIKDCESEINGIVGGGLSPSYGHLEGFSIGGIAGKNYKNIVNPKVNISGTITGMISIGGVVGGEPGYHMNSMLIDGAAVTIKESGKIQGWSESGAVIGRSIDQAADASIIKNCTVVIDGYLGDEDLLGFNFGGIAGATNATIENCTVTISGKIEGQVDLAGISGAAFGPIKNCKVDVTEDGVINGESQIGGIVGNNQFHMASRFSEYGIEDCTVIISGQIGNIDGDFEGEYIGGLAGINRRGVKNSHVTVNKTGTIQGGKNTGGFAGISLASHYGVAGSELVNDGGVIENSVDITGNIIGDEYVGGFAGQIGYAKDYPKNENNNVKINKDGIVRGNENIGGFAGEVSTGQSYNEVNPSFAGNNVVDIYGEISGDKNVGGYIGDVPDNMNIGYVDEDVNKPIKSGEVYIEGVITGNENVGGYIGNIGGYNQMVETVTAIKNIDIIVEGTGEISGQKNVGGMIGLAEQTEIFGNSIELNLNVTGNENVGGVIGEITTVDMESNEITLNNTVKGTGDNVGGFVGLVSSNLGSGFNDIKIDSGSRIEGNNNVGGIVGNIYSAEEYSASSFFSVYDYIEIAAGSNIIGNNNIGGIVGNGSENSNFRIENLNNDEEVIGGVKLNGEIKAKENNVGGIIGKNEGNIYITYVNIEMLGSSIISGNNNVGGIVGNNNAQASLYLTNLYYPYYANISDAEFISEIKIDGIITANGDNVGGIVGKISDNTYAALEGIKLIVDGTISGKDNVGGLVGIMEAEADYPEARTLYMNDVVINGNIEGTNNVGGVIGNSNIQEGYNDSIYSVLKNKVLINNGASIIGTTNVGGYAGLNADTLTFIDIEILGNIIGVNNLGLLVGSNLNSSKICDVDVYTDIKDIWVFGSFGGTVSYILNGESFLENTLVADIAKLLQNLEGILLPEGTVSQVVEGEVVEGEAVEGEAEEVTENETEEVIESETEEVTENETEEVTESETEEVTESETEEVTEGETEEVIESEAEEAIENIA